MWKNRINLQKELIKHNKQYDWIISTRVDLKYFKDLDYSLLDPDSINIPYGSEFGGYQDKIAIGKSEMIIEYLDLYKYMPEYLKTRTISPEILLKYHLIKQNISVNRIDFEHKINPKVSLKNKYKLAK